VQLPRAEFEVVTLPVGRVETNGGLFGVCTIAVEVEEQE
jgi:hypothetical protein